VLKIDLSGASANPPADGSGYCRTVIILTRIGYQPKTNFPGMREMREMREMRDFPDIPASIC